jgi:1-acyl-sn-glycerol-3-phosphate acyltransferase
MDIALAVKSLKEKYPIFDWKRDVLVPIYRAGARRLARLIWKPEFIGFDKIPKDGPVLLIANHVSYVDGVILYAACDRPVRFLMDGLIFKLPLVHHFMSLARAIPILPNRESVSKAFAEVSDALKAGEVVCVFPEGQLTYTGSLGRFRPGIESIIKRDPMPVYPIAINGLWGSIFSRKYRRSKFRWWPRNLSARIQVICGDPIPAPEVSVNRLQREVLRLKHLLSNN